MKTLISALLLFSPAAFCQTGTPSTDKVEAHQEVIIDQEPTETIDIEKVYMVADQQPEFPGGTEKQAEFFSTNIKYPESAKANNIKGTVYMQFVVEKDGKLSRIVVIKGLSPDCDKEALRVVRSMPDWIPGKTQGQIVRVRMTIPIKFEPK